MTTLIKYNGTDITLLAKTGRWFHPDTGVKYPVNWDFSQIDGITIEEVEEILTLAEVLANKNAEITQARENANNGTFEWNGKIFDGSRESRDKIVAVNGAVNLAEPKAMPSGWVGGWKSEDNSLVSIPDVPTWTAFYSAMIATGQANFLKGETLKAQAKAIYENPSLSEVEKIEQINSISWGTE